MVSEAEATHEADGPAADTDVDEPPLRLTMTFPGSASLGAFQAGAAAALTLTAGALRSQGHRIRLDAVGGASAGSFVALFLAHCAAEGLDAASVLRRAWVERVDVDLLRADHWTSPLGFTALREALPDFFADADPSDEWEPNDIALHVGLTNLFGLDYAVRTRSEDVRGLTFVDWAQFPLRARGGLEQLTEPEGCSALDHVLASAAHPGAFAPRRIDRSPWRDEYERNGVTNVPDHGVMWFTDGGLVETEPVGRLIQLADVDDGAGARIDAMHLHLVIDPRASVAATASPWSDDEADPSWLDGLRRAVSVLPTQALHEDLRRVAVDNERLTMAREIADVLKEVDDGTIAARLERWADERQIEHAEGDAVLAALEELGGVQGKHRVDVDVISPRFAVEDDENGVRTLLAGDFVGAFGGFLSEELRASDFALGWESVTRWSEEALDRHGIPSADRDGAVRRLRDHPMARPDDILREQTDVSNLSFRNRLRLARLAARSSRIILSEALPSLPWSGGR